MFHKSCILCFVSCFYIFVFTLMKHLHFSIFQFWNLKFQNFKIWNIMHFKPCCNKCMIDQHWAGALFLFKHFSRCFYFDSLKRKPLFALAARVSSEWLRASPPPAPSARARASLRTRSHHTVDGASTMPHIHPQRTSTAFLLCHNVHHRRRVPLLIL